MSASDIASERNAGSAVRPPEPRRYRGVNWLGLKTLYLREVRRFWKVGMQTVAAPVITTLLYMLVFVVAMQGASPPVHGVPFSEFVAPGLIMMAVLNNAFANASSSLIQAKIMGTAPDFMTPPLSPFEQAAGFSLGAATRGVAVGLVTAIVILGVFAFMGDAGLRVRHPWAVLYYGAAASFMLGFTGVIAGLWSEKFDQLAAVTNFVIVPLTFLSGTFYLIDRLPEPFRTLSYFNPFFYLIDGFRYGFIGEADGSLAIGVAVTATITVALGFTCWLLFRRGWRLKT